MDVAWNQEKMDYILARTKVVLNLRVHAQFGDEDKDGKKVKQWYVAKYILVSVLHFLMVTIDLVGLS